MRYSNVYENSKVVAVLDAQYEYKTALEQSNQASVNEACRILSVAGFTRAEIVALFEDFIEILGHSDALKVPYYLEAWDPTCEDYIPRTIKGRKICRKASLSFNPVLGRAVHKFCLSKRR